MTDPPAVSRVDTSEATGKNLLRKYSPTSSDDASFKAIDFDFNSPPANVPIARDIRIRLSGKLRDAILDLIEICGDGTYKQVARVFLSNEELKESTQILVSRYVWRGCTEGQYLFRLDSAPFDGKTRQQTKAFWGCDPRSISQMKLEIHSTRESYRGVQLAMLKLVSGLSGEYVPIKSVESRSSKSPENETVEKLIDNDSKTKWFDQSINFLGLSTAMIEIAKPHFISHYELVTANDNPGRDPVRWTVAGRLNKKEEWRLLHSTLLKSAKSWPLNRHQTYGRMKIDYPKLLGDMEGILARKSKLRINVLCGPRCIEDVFTSVDRLLEHAGLQDLGSKFASLEDIYEMLSGFDWEKKLEEKGIPTFHGLNLFMSLLDPPSLLSPGTIELEQAESGKEDVKTTTISSSDSKQHEETRKSLVEISSQAVNINSGMYQKRGTWLPTGVSSNPSHLAHPTLIFVQDSWTTQTHHFICGGFLTPNAVLSLALDQDSNSDLAHKHKHGGRISLHPELPFSVHQAGGFAYGGCVHVIGGQSSEKDGQGRTNFVRLDPSTNEWTRMEPLPDPCRTPNLLVGVSGDYLIAFKSEGSKMFLFDLLTGDLESHYTKGKRSKQNWNERIVEHRNFSRIEG